MLKPARESWEYIPFMSQHENYGFNRCYCLAEHKTPRLKRKLKRTPGHIHRGILSDRPKGNRHIAVQFSVRCE